MLTDPNWNCHLRALLLDDSGRILLTETEQGWDLPAASHPQYISPMGNPLIAQTFNASINGQFHPLYCVWFKTNVDEKWGRRIYRLEVLTPGWNPPDHCRWFHLEELASLSLADPELPDTLHTHLAARTSPKTAPWARPGWYGETLNWIHENLENQNRPLSGPPELVKTWALSIVLRLPTQSGLAYFKAACFSPLFGNEAASTQFLAQRFPGQVPAPLAVDIPNNWLLLEDFGKALYENKTPEIRVEAQRRYAQLQIQSIPHLDSLLQNGCLDRRLAWMQEKIPYVLQAEEIARVLAPDDLAILKQAAPWLEARLRALSDMGIPATLVHGDLHEGNMAAPNGQPLYFDWTDACISHPFMDLLALLWEEDETARESLLAAYLQPWQEHLSLSQETLRQAWELAKPITAFNQIISYISLERHQNDGLPVNVLFGAEEDPFMNILLEAIRSKT